LIADSRLQTEERNFDPPDSRTITELGRMEWQNLIERGKRARAENAIGGYKSTNGTSLRSRMM